MSDTIKPGDLVRDGHEYARARYCKHGNRLYTDVDPNTLTANDKAHAHRASDFDDELPCNCQ